MDVLLSCDQGRESVIRIVELMGLIMKTLRHLKPNQTKKKAVLQEYLTNIQKEFQNLRTFYDFCETKGPKCTDLESLIPFEDKIPTKEPTKAYAEACKERDAVKEEVVLKNLQLAEVITHMRNTVFMINCMLAHADEEKPKK